MNRRRFLQGSAVGAAAVAALGLPQLAGVASAQGGGQPMTIRVEEAHLTMNAGAPPSATYFIVVGDITEVDGDESATGKFFCRGVLFPSAGAPDLIVATPPADAISFVDQRFRIDGVGTIQGAGAEGDSLGEPLAIGGGTGRFVGAHGTYSGVGNPIPFPPGEGLDPGEIIFEFNIRRG